MTDHIPGKPARRWVSPVLLIGVMLVTAGLTIGVSALLVDIFEKKQEARNPFFRVVELNDETVDPAVWGKNFPLHYDGYKRTVDMQRTRFGGSEAVPRTPSQADPRSIVAHSRLESDSRLKALWAGYAFQVDFREERGHAYMLEDQVFTGRQTAAKQPGTCLHCHASVYVAYKQAGNGDLIKGFEALNPLPYAEARQHVSHPISCIDCHDPTTMALRVTRPGFLEGIKPVKAAAGMQDYDVNTQASRQEMRTYVCAQCHVEYYFKGPQKRLTYPWHKGLKADQILEYYDEVGHKDWEHALSGAAVLKAQHPEFELWSQGIHARAGVACADCHMPYQRIGALKISDHHVRSPLLNIANACQTCHRVPEDELRARAETIQERTYQLRDLAMNAVLALIGDLESARQSGTSDEALASPRAYQRRAQFLLDFIEAENSMGFHADQEAARLLAKAIDFARQGQVALRDGVEPAPSTPVTLQSQP